VLVATTPDGRQRERETFASASTDEVVWLFVQDAEKPAVTVVEVLDGDRRPQPGVRVVCNVMPPSHRTTEVRTELAATTDDCGLARLTLVGRKLWLLQARDAHGRVGARLASSNTSWVVVPLAAPGSVRGRLLAPPAVAIPDGTRVELHAGANGGSFWRPHGFTTTVAVVEGEFTAELPAG
jgi:hypothetical protein